jgi:hypothetical protein
MFGHARRKQPGYQGTEIFPTKKNPFIYNECLVDLQVDISNAEMLNPNAKCWEKETNDRIIA